MKSLTEFINESLVNESFKSDIMRKCFLGVRGRIRTNSRFDRYWWLQWDKIEDSDLKELTIEEAQKRMRSKKDPGYIIWVYGEWEGHARYCNVTYGTDIVLTYDGNRKDITATAISKDANKAYEVIDFERFETREMRAERARARQGALALQDCYTISRENIERYKEALAKARTPETETYLDKIQEITDMYKNVIDKWVGEYMKQLQEGAPSWYHICDILNKIHKAYAQICSELADMTYYKDKRPQWALESYKNFTKLVGELESMIQGYLEESK